MAIGSWPTENDALDAAAKEFWHDLNELYKRIAMIKSHKITSDDIENDIAPRWQEGHFDAAYWMDDVIAALRRNVKLEKVAEKARELVDHYDRCYEAWIINQFKGDTPEVRDGDRRDLKDALEELEK